MRKGELSLAPMEEITGYVFRRVLDRHFGHVDKYYTPFIATSQNIKLKTRALRELLPENNEGIRVIPQVLSNNYEDFNRLVNRIAEYGYDEVNINFGCPSSTVVSKCKGSGIFKAPDILRTFMDGIFNGDNNIFIRHPDFRYSIKTRVGFDDTDDFYEFMDIINAYPISELIVHPRIREDYYTGVLRLDMFEYALKVSKCRVIYNGDIRTIEDYRRCISLGNSSINSCVDDSSNPGVREVAGVMIGRGAICEPGIFREIRTGKKMSAGEYKSFLDDLYETYKAEYSIDNALFKMKEIWGYVTASMDDKEVARKIQKEISKATNEPNYKSAVREAFANK